MENGFRDKDTLTRKDVVFGAVNILATEDKRTLRGVDRLGYVLKTAQALFEWVQNGRVEKVSADQTSLECDSCLKDFPESESYDLQLNGEPSIVCRRCFEELLEESKEVVQDVPV